MGKVLLETFVTCAVVLVLAGCGDDGEQPAASSPAVVTPVPSTAPVPSPTSGIHASPGAEATAGATATATAPSGTGTGGAEAGEDGNGGAGAGDENGVRQPVDVTITADRIRASVDKVAAFLPVRFAVHNTLGKELQVVIVQSGEGGSSVGRATVPAGGLEDVDVDGLQPGSIEVLSPDLDPDMTAIVAVVRGG
jgi:hypothetical protein